MTIDDVQICNDNPLSLQIIIHFILIINMNIHYHN